MWIKIDDNKLLNLENITLFYILHYHYKGFWTTAKDIWCPMAQTLSRHNADVQLGEFNSREEAVAFINKIEPLVAAIKL